jgi:hypothetical protein
MMHFDDLAPNFSPARYAKGKVVVQCPSKDGYKTRAARLAAALPGYWSNRSKGYIMSPTAAAKLKALYAAGKDAKLGDKRGRLDWVLE